MKFIVKSELIDETWNALGKKIEKNKIEIVINTFVRLLGNELKNLNNVKLDGFGTFVIKEKPICINGITKQSKRIKFNPSRNLKK